MEATRSGADRRLLAGAAILALLLPVGVAGWLLRGGGDIELTPDGAASRDAVADLPGPGGERSPPAGAVPGPGGDGPVRETPDAAPDDAAPTEAPVAEAPVAEADAEDTAVADAVRPLPECLDAQPPDVRADQTVLTADVEGRGCTVGVLWDGRYLAVPLTAGETVRYDLAAAPGDVLLLGDWSCDGRDTPALYRPEDGRLFVFDAFGDEVTARGVASGVRHGEPVIVTGADGCQRVEIEDLS